MVKAFWLFILGFFISLTFGDSQDLINVYCEGDSYNCYLCTDGNTIKRCYNQLCTIGLNKCGCPSGFIYNPQTGKCEYTPQTQVSYIDCSSWGYSYSECSTPFMEVLNVSVREQYSKSGCSLNYSYGIKKPNKIWVDHGCRANFKVEGITCPSGSFYNAVLHKCELSLSCPIGNYPCIKYTDGYYYCSPYNCYNPLNTPTVSEDTPEGAYDKQNDGQITEQGCLGNIYIFNGHDYRCRPPGIQTGFSDCCEKEHTWFGLGMCSQRERYLSRLRAWGQRDGKCHYIGEYCAEKWLGVCVQKKKTFCCYSSPLARIVIEAAHQQLGISWGDPKHPNCRGLTPEEFQKLDFSKINFSEWIDYEIQENIVPSINTSLQNALNNMQTTVSTSVPSSP